MEYSKLLESGERLIYAQYIVPNANCQPTNQFNVHIKCKRNVTLSVDIHWILNPASGERIKKNVENYTQQYTGKRRDIILNDEIFTVCTMLVTWIC